MKIISKLICNYAGESKTILLEGHQSLGRPSKSSDPDIPLHARSVSRKHGEFYTEDGTCMYKDLGGANGTIYNGKRLNPGTIRVLKDGDVLKIHGIEDPDRLMDVELIYTECQVTETLLQTTGMEHYEPGNTTQNLRPEENAASTEENKAAAEPEEVVVEDWRDQPAAEPEEVAAEDWRDLPAEKPEVAAGHWATRPGRPRPVFTEGLEVRIQDRTVGSGKNTHAILRDINFDINNGSMVLVLGGSGAGKTTLVNAIMGYEKANGTILYNGSDIYKDYEKMKYEIGYVPQQDLLRMTDTVYDTLLNAAHLRLPAKKPDSYYEEAALATMEMLGLKREKESLVKKLSGGQRKRLSIAVEYVGNPSLFFLDEPDSGLDGIMARELMNNLRTIADEGKIVIVITHSPDRAFELFDNVVVLAKDTRDNCGHLVFEGSPIEACDFFEVGDFESIVRRINREDEGGEGLAEYYIQKFENS